MRKIIVLFGITAFLVTGCATGGPRQRLEKVRQQAHSEEQQQARLLDRQSDVTDRGLSGEQL